MSGCRIDVICVGQLHTNCYLIMNRANGQVVVVDPGDEKERIKQAVSSMNGKITAILLTHGHYDHIKDADALRSEENAPIYAFDEEKDVLESPYNNVSSDFGDDLTVKPDHYISDGDHIEEAGLDFYAMHTPGHTKGSGSFYLESERSLFCGDTLFARGYGRTDLPTGDIHQLVNSLTKKLFVLPEDITVFPGHGPATDIGTEKRHNGIA